MNNYLYLAQKVAKSYNFPFDAANYDRTTYGDMLKLFKELGVFQRDVLRRAYALENTINVVPVLKVIFPSRDTAEIRRNNSGGFDCRPYGGEWLVNLFSTPLDMIKWLRITRPEIWGI